MKKKWTKEEICTHLGDDYDRYMGAVVPPIFQNSLFVAPRTETGETSGSGPKFFYTRGSNPTIQVAEQKIAALEGGEAARCFGSGMAAITSSILHCIAGNSHIVAMDTIYPGTKSFLNHYLPKFGVETTYISGGDLGMLEEAIRPDTRLIYLESPSYLIFDMVDIERVAKLAKSRGIITMLDNTLSTPLFQNPLEMGVDIVVHSASKYLGGHSDIVAGVAVGSQEIMESIARNEREHLGAVMDPHQAWLLTRGIRTLPVRMRQHQENAIQIAKFLERHPKILKAYYPGLESHPKYELGKKQLTGYSGLMSVAIATDSAGAADFVKRLQLFQNGPSWGGFESLAYCFGEHQVDAGASKGVSGQIIRLSIGLEHADSLLTDLESSLRHI